MKSSIILLWIKERQNKDEKVWSRGIVFVSSYEYKNGNPGRRHSFVIIEYDTEQNAHVTTSYYSEELEGGGNYVYFNFNNKL